jgi:hypothetical protein
VRRLFVRAVLAVWGWGGVGAWSGPWGLCPASH